MRGARRILEIGTLGGYSTIWMARALPKGGRVISIEISTEHALVARENIARAGLSDRVDITVSPAIDALAKMTAAQVAPFDFVFIDADKQNIDAYFRAAIDL